MPVTITTTPGTAYVWGNAAFRWDAIEAGKAWQDASATSFLAEESDGLLLAPVEARLPIVNDSESLGLADADAFAATASAAEALSLAETYIDLIAFILTAAESIGIGEIALRQMTQSPFAEMLGLIDSVSKNPLTVTNGVHSNRTLLVSGMPSLKAPRSPSNPRAMPLHPATARSLSETFLQLNPYRAAVVALPSRRPTLI